MARPKAHIIHHLAARLLRPLRLKPSFVPSEFDRYPLLR
jgi:hypothetical protein